MSLLPSLFALKRLAVELRGLRRAAERIADCLELQAQTAPRSGQSFRGMSRDPHPSEGEQSSVSYVDRAEMELAFEKEGELVAILGRQPTPEELEIAMRGDIE